jgi:hypothetical protein
MGELRVPGGVRVRRFADGSYAVSAIDRATRRATLLEGDATRARLVRVAEGLWSETTTAPVRVPSGSARATIEVVAGADGTVRREAVTRYPNGTRRADRAVLTAERLERESRWELPRGRVAEATWEPGGDRTLVVREPQGEPSRILRTSRDAASGELTTAISAPDGRSLGSIVSRGPAGGPRRGEAYDESGEAIVSFSRQTQSGPGGSASITTAAHKDGTIEQHVVTTEAAGTASQDMTIRPDGSGSIDSTATLNKAGGGSFTIRQSGTMEANGASSNSITTTDNDTGASATLSSGTNAGGEVFRSSSATDGEGNFSQTTVTYHDDGSFTLTTTSEGSDGQGTVESTTFDAQGNEIGGTGPTPSEGGAEGGGEGGGAGGGEGGSEGEGGGGETEGTGGGSGAGGEGSMPSEDGTDEGPPGRGGVADGALGGILGVAEAHGPAPLGPTDGEGDADAADLVAAVGDRLSSELVLGGGGDDGWGEAGADEGPRRLLSDELLDAPLVTASEDWGDLVNPRALVGVVARIAGSVAAEAARVAMQGPTAA